MLILFGLTTSTVQADKNPFQPPKSTVKKKVSKPSLVPSGWPKTLYIPRTGITSPVEDIAFKNKRDFDAPFKWFDVAWYDRGPRPGDQGRAVIFGHLDSYTGPAAFYQLRNLHTGDIVRIAYKTRHPLNFRVMWRNSYPNNAIPNKFIFAPVRERGLVLMTCTGIFHRDGTGYDRKEIVYARLILPNGKLG